MKFNTSNHIQAAARDTDHKQSIRHLSSSIVGLRKRRKKKDSQVEWVRLIVTVTAAGGPAMDVALYSHGDGLC